MQLQVLVLSQNEEAYHTRGEVTTQGQQQERLRSPLYFTSMLWALYVAHERQHGNEEASVFPLGIVVWKSMEMGNWKKFSCHVDRSGSVSLLLCGNTVSLRFFFFSLCITLIFLKSHS